ncbi:CBS domain-containing protein [Desmospora profundinema]|uniref:CBS domain-containing protein n=1 Tax=Desmospora profundinema TaxID=1571184 RepID=A0ABU1IHS0_9BACL|nr:CBS domain-containing protein [Desmospora profundinema]MDR6224092.1 CBS domain-containing protein [Desmospora profundinema]
MKVKAVYQTVTKQANILPITTPFHKIQEVFEELHPIHRSIYVVNEQNQLQGCITIWRFLKLVAIKTANADQVNLSPSLRELSECNPQKLTAGMMMHNTPSVTLEDSLEVGLQYMIINRLEELPVVDRQGVVIGDLNVFEIMRHISDQTTGRI